MIFIILKRIFVENSKIVFLKTEIPEKIAQHEGDICRFMYVDREGLYSDITGKLKSVKNDQIILEQEFESGNCLMKRDISQLNRMYVIRELADKH